MKLLGHDVSELESVTCSVNVYVPASLGVPVSQPFGSSVTPSGREPV